jgi:hypothetical protein
VGTVEPIDGIVSGGTAMALRRSLAGLLGVPALLLPALLAGCGDDSSVADPPVQSAPPSIATSDPPAHESAEHFIRRWAGVEKQMENTGKTAAYLSLSGKCRSCRQLASDIRHFYTAGGFAQWAGWRIRSITPDGSHGDRKVFDVEVDSGQTKYRESSSAPIKHLAGGPSTHQLVIEPRGSSWLLVGKAQLAQ